MSEPTDNPAATHILAAPLRPVTVGMLALISILAFEHLAVATAMPTVAQALNGMALYAAAFGVALAAGIVGMAWAGSWSDRVGPSQPLWVGVAAFTVGVLAAGGAPSMWILVVGRALQGFGGGLLSVALYVLVGRVVPRSLHPRMFAAFAGAWVLPALVGPVLTGLIAEHLGWRWVFFAAAAAIVPSAWLLARGLSRWRLHPGGVDAAAPPRPNGYLRWTAVTAICAGLLYAAGGGGTGAAPLLVATAVLGIALFAPRLLPQGTLLGRAGLPAVVALRGLAAAAFFCGEVLLPLLLVQERGLSATQSGLVLTAGALGWSAGSWFQGRCRLEGQARVRRLQRGMAAIGGGGLLVALVAWPAVPVGVALVGWTIAGGGIGLVYPTLSVLTLECAPPGQHGQASSALQLSDSLFSAVALAVASMLPAVVFADVAGAPQVAGFGLAAALALTGVAVAARTRPTASVG